MKLSFSLPSKSSSKPNPIKPSKTFDDANARQNGDVSKQFVKEFDASKPLTGGPKAPVIAPIENEWRPHKKMKNLELPITEPGGQDLKFEPESLSVEPDSNISYGLNVRKASESENSGSGAGGERLRSGGVEETLLEKFKSDLERLSDHKGMEEYEGMPVEGYGAALLSGYGWYPGRGIGRNAKEDVKVVEYTKSTDRHGLGFHKNPKEKKEEIRKEKEEVAKEVRIVKGRDYVGCRGRVVERLGNGRLVLKLAKRGKDQEEVEVKVNVDDVVEVGSKEEDKWRRLKEQEVKVGRSDKPRREDQRSYSSWLARHIRVRVISKELRGGKLYLKKGEIVDVVGPSTCDISMDGSREFIQGVSENLLETALPRRGGPVLVLSGKHKGVFGSLVEKDADRETGVVKDADTHVLLNVRLEQIAEFTGDPSYLGY
ncbi:putative G-patch domain-containing protein [Rosa chinensis]|uniref:Putative G-patch domain-containing protein n=1 Tax=Rosa chinensis TaxID=74649 RepID=A0A2P6QBW6_ROSCH|nr:protein MOS2 [Rosa chinensis]PRQ31671.1 putative G-patch domain-containing protein [Rosa chinensis]